ncbi:MAG: hypothetical protein ACX936_21415, partial [Marinobacter sp.]
PGVNGELFRSDLITFQKALSRFLVTIGFKANTVIDAEIIARELTYWKVCRIATDQYKVQVETGRWYATQHTRDSKALSRSYSAAANTASSDVQDIAIQAATSAAYALMANKSLTSKDFNSNKGKSDRKSGNFRSKSSPGKSNNTPKNSSKDGNRRKSGGKDGKDHKPDPKFNPPQNGEPTTKVINGRTYHWCGHCRYGKGRWTTTHGTNEHVKKKPSSPNNGGAVASLAFYDDPSAWIVEIPSYMSILVAIDSYMAKFLLPSITAVLLLVASCCSIRFFFEICAISIIFAFNWLIVKGADTPPTLTLWSIIMSIIGLSTAHFGRETVPKLLRHARTSTPKLAKTSLPQTLLRAVPYLCCSLIHLIWTMLWPSSIHQESFIPATAAAQGPFTRSKARRSKPPLRPCARCFDFLPPWQLSKPDYLCSSCRAFVSRTPPRSPRRRQNRRTPTNSLSPR